MCLLKEKFEQTKHSSFYLKKKKRPLRPWAQVTDDRTANTNEVLETGFHWAMDGNTFTPNKQGLMGWIL